MKAQWKVLPPPYTNYSVSNTGLVKAADGTILKQQVYNNYLSVRLYSHAGDKWFKVHRLVAERFVPNPDNKPVVNHLDFNTYNNHSYNLVWVTHKENVDYSKDRMNYNRYKVNQLDEDGNIINTFNSCQEAVTEMGGKNNGSAVAKAIKKGSRSYGYYWERATTISKESTPK